MNVVNGVVKLRSMKQPMDPVVADAHTLQLLSVGDDDGDDILPICDKMRPILPIKPGVFYHIPRNELDPEQFPSEADRSHRTQQRNTSMGDQLTVHP